MAKRSATDSSSEPSINTKTSRSSEKRNVPSLDDVGEFEDAWEDELESDGDVVDADAQDGTSNRMDVDEVLPTIEESEEQPHRLEAFIPGTHSLAKDEILEPDDSVYIMRHSMDVTWSCLSFDILRDSLGEERQRYPATAYVVAGTQAARTDQNELSVFKMSSLYRTQKDGDDDEEDEDEDEDGALDEDAVLEFRSVPHHGGVNRVRVQPLPPSTPLVPVSQPYYAATWSESGKVHVWDIRPLIGSLDIPGYSWEKSRTNSPIFTINSHGRVEGFAMDWAASVPTNPSALRLLTGDVHSKIYLTTSTPSGFNTLVQPFTSHTSSVEDIQWSPSESTVFASCSADRSVQIWDVRSKKRRSVTGIDPAHESDVNVISWNKNTNHLLISGGDDGAIKVWDLRSVSKPGSPRLAPSPVAAFTWHNGPITSIEWHPTEDSIFAASGADDQVTLWDLGVEQDDEEAASSMNETQEGSRDVPPQLLFVHQGQRDVKEIHWHPQIPGTVISTALDGFNIFKTISV